ncbi:MAG: type II toxin-antitoxin system RelE/ParE family toxin [Acidobacteriaceae bacterium]
MIEIRRYLTPSGKDVFGAWLAKLEPRARAKVIARLDRLALGNFGGCKFLHHGVFELRIDWGPDYRVYYGKAGNTTVLLLCGGDKRKQSSDIERAMEYLEEFEERAGRS